MEQYTIERDGELALKFTGELIASSESSPNNAYPNYSGNTGLWSEFRIYKTKAGKFVCENIARTQWQGQSDSYTAKVCNTENEVIEFFGFGWLAKDLYKEAGIECVEEIE